MHHVLGEITALRVAPLPAVKPDNALLNVGKDALLYPAPYDDVSLNVTLDKAPLLNVNVATAPEPSPSTATSKSKLVPLPLL